MKRSIVVALLLFLGIFQPMVVLSVANDANYAGEISWHPFDVLGSTAPQVRFYDYRSLHPWDSSNSYISKTDPGEWLAQMPICKDVGDVAPCISSLMGRATSSSPWQEFTPGISLSQKLFKNSDGGVVSSDRIYGSFPSDSARNRPIGALTRIWTSPQDLSTSGGNKYLLLSSIGGNWNGGILNLSLTPVKTDTALSTVLSVGSYGQTDCPWSYNEIECIQIFNFPLDAQYKVDLHLGNWLNQIVPWYHGRLADPSLSVTGLGSDAHLVVQGNPMQTLVAQAPMSIEKILSLFPGLDASTFGKPPASSPVLAFNGGESLSAFELIQKDILPIALGKTDVWRLTSISASQRNQQNSCFTNLSFRIGGVVITNATTYDPEPPSWDPINRSLNYTVAGPHYSNSNVVFSGEYRIIIDVGAANCLWGLDSNRARASISILDENGISQITTASTTIKDENVYMSVTGFHYSVAKISVRLETIATPTPTPTPTPEPTSPPSVTTALETTVNTNKPIAGKKSTIVCYKGKVIRKVTAIKPTCPRGYKKK